MPFDLTPVVDDVNEIVAADINQFVTALETVARAPMLVVAATDSPANIKASADYVCDGSADQTEINAALTAAGTTATVLIAAGAYATSAAITPTTGQTLILHPRATITRSGTGNAIEVIGTSGAHKSDVRIEGGRLLGPSVSGTQVAGSGVYLEWVDRGSVLNLYASGFGSGSNDGGIQLLDTTDVEIHGCTLTANKNGICTGQPSATAFRDLRPRISNNLCFANFDDGIHTQRSRHVTITGNICYGHPNGGAADGSGIDLLGDEGDTVTGNVCFDNARGIEVGNTQDGTYPDQGHTISGNVCHLNDDYGITLIGRMQDVRVVGNAITDNVTNGIRIGTATSTLPIEDVTISNNDIHDNGSIGIDVFGYVVRPTITGNTMSGNTEDIQIRTSTGTPSDPMVTDNRLHSTATIDDQVGDADGWLYPNYGRSSNPANGGLSFTINDGGTVIAAGIKGEGIRVPFACTVLGWVIEGNISGSIVVDVDRAAAGSTTYTSIAGTEKPTLSSAILNTDTALTTWTTSLAEGDKLRFEAEGTPATVTRVTVSLLLRRV